MAFDAGSIIARLDLDDDDFDRKLRADVAKIENFEKRSHEIKITPRVDESDTSQARRAFQRLDQQITNDARSRSRSGNGSVLGMLAGLFRGGSGGAAAGGGGFLSSLGSAAGPGILGIGAKPALIGAAVPVAAAALPSLLGIGGTAIGGGLGLGVAGLLGMQAAKPAAALAGAREQAQQAMAAAVTPAQRQAAAAQLQSVNQQVAKLSPALHSIFTSISQIQAWWEKFTKSLAPLLAPALHQIVPMITSLGPAIRSMFAGAMTIVVPFMRALTAGLKEIIPLLGQMFRASAPGFAVLTRGLLTLVKDILPGLITLIKATAPVMGMFARTLGTLGADLGKMFAIMAPAVKPSMIILDSLLKAVGGLLPIIGKFAVIAARLLAPVFVVLARVVTALLPILSSLAKIFAEFAGAALADVVAVLGALATLLKDLAPSFAILAKVAGQVFKTLENSGVFQVMANALEKLAGPLARVINLLVKDLAPDIPVILKLVVALSDVLVNLLAAGLTTILNGITWLLKTFPGLIQLLGLVAAAWVIVDTVMSANPIGLIIISIVALIGAITLLATHWHRVWTDVRNWAQDAWNFLTHGWGQVLIPQLFLIRKTVEFVRDHWKQAWNDIKGAALDAWHFIHDDIIAPLVNVFTQTLPNAFDTAVRAIGSAWDKIRDIIRTPVAWVVDNVLDGLIRVFDWITSKVGLGKPIKEVHPFGLQRGGRLPGFGGGDILPALLEPGETVVSKEDSRQPFMKAAFSAAGVPGYQQGGLAGARANLPSLQRATKRSGGWLGDAANFLGGLVHKAGDLGKITAAIFSGNTTALVNAIGDMLGHPGTGGATGLLGSVLTAVPRALIHEIASHLIGEGGGASSNAIVKYALSFLGKVPYVWGGDTPSGWDCSGFVEYIYNHFGIHPPRTADAQWGWVRRVGAPTPGGLAFGAGADGSAANPGHVGIAIGRGRMVNAYTTGTNTIISPIAGSMGAVTGYGIPPGGFGGAGRGMAQRGSWTLPGLEGLWRQAGGPGGIPDHIAGAIALAESGGNPRARNPSGASGLWQILGQVVPGNIFNPFVNAVNAVTKYQQAGGFSPWVTYTSGAYRQFMDSGGWLPAGGMNGTGRPEAVLNPAQSDAFVALADAMHRMSRNGSSRSLEHVLERIARSMEQNPNRTGAAVAEALTRSGRRAAYTGMYGGGP